MARIEIMDSTVVIDDQQIALPESVEETVRLDSTLVVLLDTIGNKNLPNNVWAIDENEGITWKIETVRSDDPFTGLWVDDGELWVYNWNGYGYKIDEQTGTIVDKKYMK
ncbi:PQQ-binding-like beta-propeller repeat protein [Natronorubrum bangense]|uniref:Uncharacterized protein n=2 Tax=Natronorubrum bangense TaxID=61858 RepID=L9WMX6_9EURY|nr:PQQ-binding-like beta-propeller repeat protein [Natronorubrum bangense]ELY50747.1 hypothetical protein C494_05220 [Natronorubrum bangense JCM 10635]QCC54362.1 hypothetical protein DV706_07585 [Natronorubrum bangense]